MASIENLPAQAFRESTGYPAYRTSAGHDPKCCTRLDDCARLSKAGPEVPILRAREATPAAGLIVGIESHTEVGGVHMRMPTLLREQIGVCLGEVLFGHGRKSVERDDVNHSSDTPKSSSRRGHVLKHPVARNGRVRVGAGNPSAIGCVRFEQISAKVHAERSDAGNVAEIALRH